MDSNCGAKCTLVCNMCLCWHQRFSCIICIAIPTFHAHGDYRQPSAHKGTYGPSWQQKAYNILFSRARFVRAEQEDAHLVVTRVPLCDKQRYGMPCLRRKVPINCYM